MTTSKRHSIVGLTHKINAAVSHIARGCRASTSHNPAFYENEIAESLDALEEQFDSVERENTKLWDALFHIAENAEWGGDGSAGEYAASLIRPGASNPASRDEA